MKLSEFLEVSMGEFHIIEFTDDNAMVIVDEKHYNTDIYDDYDVKAVYPEYFKHGFMGNKHVKCGFRICAKRNVQTVSEYVVCEINDSCNYVIPADLDDFME